MPWNSGFVEVGDPFTEAVTILQQSEPQIFALGGTTTVRWNVGVFGPALPKGRPNAGRTGDELSFDLPLATDQGRGREGYGAGEGTTTLLRDGEVVGEYDRPGRGWFEVGPDVRCTRCARP